MKGQLFTGRVYDFRKIKERYPKVLLISVMRWHPRYIRLEANGIMHMKSLSPSIKLLKYYQEKEKSERNWRSFVTAYANEFMESKLAADGRFLIRNLLIHGTDIVLLCHEKKNENCHRKILPSLLLNEREIGEIYQGEVVLEDSIQETLW